MGYPVYKLLRAVNRQYPNNGFINYVDVTEEMTNGLIDEDLRDLINETLQETYINIAKDEVFTFPTVAGQREYVLPPDCDLRDIQEVTREYRGPRSPLALPHMPHGDTIFNVSFYANGGEGEMDPIEANIGETITLPECTFTAPLGGQFSGWNIAEKIYQPGEEVSMYANLTAFAMWGIDVEQFSVKFLINPISGSINGESSVTYFVPDGDTLDEVPTPTMNAGFTMRGWSLDGINPISNEVILAKPIQKSESYIALTNGIKYTVNIYISTEGGTGILHYRQTGETTTKTRTMTYGGTPFSFTLDYSQQIDDLFTVLEMYDDTDTSRLQNFLAITITSDTDIPVAVPVAPVH